MTCIVKYVLTYTQNRSSMFPTSKENEYICGEMNKTNTLILLCVIFLQFFLIQNTAKGQSNIFVSSEVSNRSVVVCGDSTYAIFRIRNAAISTQTGVRLTCNFDAGMYYAGTP